VLTQRFPLAAGRACLLRLPPNRDYQVELGIDGLVQSRLLVVVAVSAVTIPRDAHLSQTQQSRVGGVGQNARVQQGAPCPCIFLAPVRER
jgi:hypothetical protein